MTDTTDAVDSAVNVGKTAWDIVKDGKPSSAAKAKGCNAIPKGAKPAELAGWKNKSGGWKLHYVNGFGSTVIDIELVWSFWHSGKYEDKQGLFVKDFVVYPTKCEVDWTRYASINATVSGTPMNIGSHKEPVFSVMLLVNSKCGGFLDSFNRTWRLRACGDGKLLRK